MVTGNENIQALSVDYPQLVPLFEKYGLGGYFKPDNLSKTGKFILLSTLLHSVKIDVVQFVAMLNEELVRSGAERGGIPLAPKCLHFMAMLPCGLRNPFNDFLEAHLADNKEIYAGLNYMAEGNVNHEVSYYPILDKISSEDELPDILMASDVNNFFHRPFQERFINKGYFESCIPFTPNDYLEKVGFSDPSGNYAMYTANMLVMAVDVNRLGSIPVPSKWEDLLLPAFENEIIMRGEDDFFCNAVMLPFYKDHGFDAIRTMAKNIRTGKHPSEMVKLADSGKEGAASVYIMPYFFAKKIKNPAVKLIWPEDGAIASPVFMLVKKTAKEKHQPLLDFLMSRTMGEMLVGRYFPSIHPGVENTLPEAVKWLGWDFLNSNDIGSLKDEIRDVFMDVWKQKMM